jgi:hypothetical protein
MKVFFQVADRGDEFVNLLRQVRVPDVIAIEGPGQVWGYWSGELRICGRLYPVDSLVTVDDQWHMAELTPENVASIIECLGDHGWLCQSALPELYAQWQAGRIDPAALWVVTP